jgi:hypothetical protein
MPTSHLPDRYIERGNTMIAPVDVLTAARAEALFTSDLSAAGRPAPAAVRAAIARAVRTQGGIRGCAARVAAEYGEHPETAASRMRWARAVVEQVYSRRTGRRSVADAVVWPARTSIVICGSAA